MSLFVRLVCVEVDDNVKSSLGHILMSYVVYNKYKWKTNVLDNSGEKQLRALNVAKKAMYLAVKTIIIIKDLLGIFVVHCCD